MPDITCTFIPPTKYGSTSQSTPADQSNIIIVQSCLFKSRQHKTKFSWTFAYSYHVIQWKFQFVILFSLLLHFISVCVCALVCICIYRNMFQIWPLQQILSGHGHTMANWFFILFHLDLYLCLHRIGVYETCFRFDPGSRFRLTAVIQWPIVWQSCDTILIQFYDTIVLALLLVKYWQYRSLI